MGSPRGVDPQGLGNAENNIANDVASSRFRAESQARPQLPIEISGEAGEALLEFWRSWAMPPTELAQELAEHGLIASDPPDPPQVTQLGLLVLAEIEP